MKPNSLGVFLQGNLMEDVMKRIVVIAILVLISACFVEASTTYKVKDRDCLSSVAVKYFRVSRKMIIEANNLKAPRYILRMGQVLIIPSPVKKVVSNNICRFHLVKKGDAIWKISHKYGISVKRLIKINNLRNPKLILVGQKIYLEESSILYKSRKKGLKRKINVFHWSHPGADKFGDRDRKKGICLFSVPAQVKRAWLAKVKAGDMKYISLKNGAKFNQMLFGNFRLRNNVVADWQKGKSYFSHLYTVEYKGLNYELVRPLVCSNWSWRSIVAKVKATKVNNFNQATVVKNNGFNQAVVAKDNGDCNFRLDYELFAWSGVWLAESGSNTVYWGGAFDLYSPQYNWCSRTFRIGVRFLHNEWDGYDGRSVFHYRGRANAVGPIFQFRIFNDSKVREDTMFVLFGKKDDFGHTDNGVYKMHQKSDRLIFGVSSLFYEDDFMKRMGQIYAHADLALNVSKKSSVNNEELSSGNDPGKKEDYFALGGEYTPFHEDEFYWGGTAELGYDTGDYGFDIAVGPVVAMRNDYVRARAMLGVHDISSDKGSSVVANAQVSLDLGVISKDPRTRGLAKKVIFNFKKAGEKIGDVFAQAFSALEFD